MRWYFDREDGLVKPAELSRRRFVFLVGLGAAGIAASHSGSLGPFLPEGLGEGAFAASGPVLDVAYFHGNFVDSILRPAGLEVSPENSFEELMYGQEYVGMAFPGLALESVEEVVDPAGSRVRTIRVCWATELVRGSGRDARV